MFRARKPSVKRQKLDDSTPRKRVKLINPVKELLKNETASTAEGPAKPSGTSKTGDSIGRRRSLRKNGLPKSKKAIKDDKEDVLISTTVDEDSTQSSQPTRVISNSIVDHDPVSEVNRPPLAIKMGTTEVKKDNQTFARVGEKVGEISPCTVERTSEEVEEDKEVVVVKAQAVQLAATIPKKAREEENEFDDNDDEAAKDSSACDVENVEELDNSGLWPPNCAAEDEEFVAVRPERIVDPENDPVIDAALSLLP